MIRTSNVFLMVLLLASGSGCSRPSPESGRRWLNAAMPADIKGFDPTQAHDLYTHVAVAQVYQGLLDYEYLTRPFKMKPLLAESMPAVSVDEKTYTFKLRKGVFFHDDPAFGGKPRELRASDVVYSFKRLADPATQSNMWWVLEGRIEGLDEFREKLKTLKAPVDYDAYPVTGLTAADENTVVIRLNGPYRQFLYVLAMAPTMIVAPEVVRHYGVELLNHAAGTGPFRLKEWRRGQKIIFEKNPKYWGDTYPTGGSAEDRADGLLESAGKPLPLLDGVTLWIYVETQPSWLNFLRGNLDVGGIPKEAFETALNPDGTLKEELQKKGITLSKTVQPDLVYYFFNLDDPVLGKNKYLRQAISSAINREDKIRLFYNNRAVEAAGIVPPGIFGYDPNLKNPYGYNLERAKKLIQLAREEYKKQTGKSELPPLINDLENSAVSRQLAEAMAQDLAKIGMKLEPHAQTWPQMQERISKNQVQFVGQAWHADYPDPENFFQLLYSKNVSPGPNHANFRNAEYDRLYEKMRDLPDGPERMAVIRKMTSIIQEEVPFIFFNHRIAYTLRHAWMKNVKTHPISVANYKYYEIDSTKKKATLPLLK